MVKLNHHDLPVTSRCPPVDLRPHLGGEGEHGVPDDVELGGPKDPDAAVWPARQAQPLVAT